MTYYKKIKEEIRPCVKCKCNHFIYDRNKWLCKECSTQEKKQRFDRYTSTLETNDLKKIFENIWQTRSHYCYHCGKYLGSVPKAIFFSHILSRGAHPSLRCDEENIVLACENCHYIYDFGDKSKLEKQIPNELIEELLIKERNGSR